MTESKPLPEVMIRGAGSFHLPGLGEGRIAGSGEINSSGVNTRGAASLPGGIKTELIDASGRATIHGDIDARKAALNGSTTIEGAFRFSDAESRGSLHVKRDAEGNNLETSGSTHIEGALKLTGTLTSRGGVKVEAGVEAEEVRFKGALQTRGKLTASRLHGILIGPASKIDEGITAERILIERGNLEAWFTEPELVTPSITGGDVRVEFVTCGTITGKRIELGPHCRVAGPVKYSESISVHPTAHLAEPPVKQ